MADPISLSSGILTLALFALQSSQVLYKTISSFKSNKRTVRELNEELIALQGVLESLQSTLNAHENQANLKALTLPLQRCGKACLEFEAIIAKCSADSHGVRAIRDWAKVQYMGDDIAGFKVLLSGYKSTIMIAICDVNMRTTNVTAKLLDEYKTLIEQTTSDLEEQLDGINGKLDKLTTPGTLNMTTTLVPFQEEDKKGIEEDKRSIEQCLRICVQVSEHIDQVQSNSALNARVGLSDASGPSKARKLTKDTLDGCKVELFNTTNALQKQLEDIQSRLAVLSNQPETFANSTAEEIESIKQCLAICSQASEQVKNNRVIVFEDVKQDDDGEQIIVATMGDLLSAKRVTSGSRSVQWLGQMSDESLQYLAGRKSPPSQVQQKYEAKENPNFEGRHGAGHKLLK
ncbi:hypothetical protein TWF694_006040 [Orbilia ellipsospora]|uniref:Azaphilone pigments biosynthesis cluster protein L N-terminal domain-containing protein n=1 Tax=Orbilia ellipsospora TaxID=2528407 RepID=A0AAV9WTB7_9PEZI